MTRRAFMALTAAVLVMHTGFYALSDVPSALELLEQKIVQGPSPSDLIENAYLKNPSIEAAREAWRAVIERYRVATAYPDPQLMATYFPEPIETRLGPQDWNINLTQAIPFPGKLSKAGDLVEADARMALLDLNRMIRDTIAQIRESYHELLYIEEAKRVVSQNRELVDHLRKVAETAYAQDRTTFVDVSKAQSQRAQLEYDALLLDELELTEKAQLNKLLNRPPEAVIGPLVEEPPRPVVYEVDEIYGLAKKYQEEILMAETQIQKAQAKVDLALYENLPEFKLGFFYAGIGQPDVAVPPSDAGRDAVGVQAGITIPLWFDKSSGRLAEARAEAAKARALKRSRVNDSTAEIRSVFFRWRNAERLIRLYRDQLLPQAASSMEIAETWFREKQGSFSDFVETEAVYYNFQVALARAKADYGKYLARLEKLVGRSLTKRIDDSGERSGEEGRP